MNAGIELKQDDESIWWRKELDEVGFYAWASSISTISVLDKNIEFITIYFEPNDRIKPNIKIKTENGEYDIKENGNSFTVDCRNSTFITICSDVFTVIINDKLVDRRKMSRKIRDFELTYKNGETHKININNVEYTHNITEYDKFTKDFNANGKLIELPKNKIFNISCPVKTAMFLFLHAPYDRIFETLKQYKASKNSEIIVFSDNPLVWGRYDNVIRVNSCQIDHPSENQRKMVAASNVFLKALDIANEKGIDYIFWLEWDCIFNEDYWYDKLLDEHYSWGGDIIASGTPIATPTIHNTVKQGYNLHYLMQNFTSEYIKDAKVAMGNVSTARNSLYFLNAALSFFKVKEMNEYFDDYKKSILFNSDKFMSFDVYVGVKAFEKYKDGVFDKVKWLKSSFSGGNPAEIYTFEQRMTMLNSKLKIAVHPYKLPHTP